MVSLFFLTEVTVCKRSKVKDKTSPVIPRKGFNISILGSCTLQGRAQPRGRWRWESNSARGLKGEVLRQVEDSNPSNGLEQYDVDMVQNLGCGVSQSWISVPALPFSSFMIFEHFVRLSFFIP